MSVHPSDWIAEMHCNQFSSRFRRCIRVDHKKWGTKAAEAWFVQIYAYATLLPFTFTKSMHSIISLVALAITSPMCPWMYHAMSLIYELIDSICPRKKALKHNLTQGVSPLSPCVAGFTWWALIMMQGVFGCLKPLVSIYRYYITYCYILTQVPLKFIRHGVPSSTEYIFINAIWDPL